MPETCSLLGPVRPAKHKGLLRESSKGKLLSPSAHVLVTEVCLMRVELYAVETTSAKARLRAHGEVDTYHRIQAG